MTHAVVMKMVEGLDQGHHIYVDNFYTSPQLFHDLRAVGLGACGTVRLNRRGLPKSLNTPVGKGEVKVVRVDESMLAVKWSDKRIVTILTTIHDGSSISVQRRSKGAPDGQVTVQKPKAVIEYNKFMGGVDLADQLGSYYGFEHRSHKWWKKAFFFLLEVSIVNSYVLYCNKNPNTKTRYTHLKYCTELANDLLVVAGVECTRRSLGPLQSDLSPAARLTERHFMEKTGAQRDCHLCSNRKGRKRKTSIYTCKQCELPMCVVPCFELYHTKQDPKRHLPQL